MTARLLLVVVLAVLSSSCGTPGGEAAADPLAGFAETTIVLGGEELLVAVADDGPSRSQGLRGVADLGTVDGMLFTWGGDTVTSAFTMRGVPIPLDIAFFARDGSLVDVVTMPVCSDECPSHRASGPFAFAVERPGGAFADLSDDARLEVPPPYGG